MSEGNLRRSAIDVLTDQLQELGEDGRRVLAAYLELAGWTPDLEPTYGDVAAIVQLDVMLRDSSHRPSEYRWSKLVAKVGSVIPTGSKVERNDRGQHEGLHVSDQTDLDGLVADMILAKADIRDIARVLRKKPPKNLNAKLLIEDLVAIHDGKVESHPPATFKRQPVKRRVRF